jgi:UDP-N-acetylglucosamine 2-epimerase (non-hydrolysing)
MIDFDAVGKIGKIISGYDVVLVQGDTMTAAAGAIAAFNSRVKIGHIEAGLRTQDITSPYPEEGYRSIISRIANWHFCPTENAADNLHNEKVPGKIYITGNTIIDLISLICSNDIEENGSSKTVIITMHRRENIPHLQRLLNDIKIIASNRTDLNWIMPVHPNPEVKSIVHNILKNSVIQLVDPFDYPDFINTLKKCLLIITDSGGIQEEAAFLKKRVIVCRKSTERPEGIQAGYSILAFDNLKESIELALKTKHKFAKNPYGDGKSSEKIASIIGIQTRNK